jgi:tetratricopeptide (TPR) repeat protein
MAKKPREKATQAESNETGQSVSMAASQATSNGIGRWLATVIVVVSALVAIWYFAVLAKKNEPVPEVTSSIHHATYVGSKSCIGCHAEQSNAWKGSDHDLAMQVADGKSVLGDFSDTRFTYAGVSTRFFQREGKYFVSTDGPNGVVGDFEIKYTFGVRPLQQYLIEMPGGRLQAFGIAWDARNKASGGQRWFHLYPNDALKAGDALHWTGVNQNWNFMCAECHSTALQKNYDAKQEIFSTTWKELNVACEACHGPASQHVTWASKPEADRASSRDKGLVNLLNDRHGVAWTTSHGTTPPMRQTENASAPRGFREFDTCARCHTRASRISDDYVHGRSLLDSHIPALISEGLYWNDGQQRDEVFTNGSFGQSKMHAKGVTCSNCHEPHSLKLRAPGNAVCSQCHEAQKFDAPSHTHHAKGSDGATCTACHMPPTTYMQVDPRHDHSMRIPRPDLSVKFGLEQQPNACNSCHTKKTAAWAVEKVREWNPKPNEGFQTFAESFHEIGLGELQAATRMQALVADKEQLPLVRASAIERLGRLANPSMIDSFVRGLNDADPQVRLAGVNAIASLSPEERRRYLARMVNDPVLGVRASAARALAGPAESGMTAEERRGFESALADYIGTLDYNSDRPESQMGLGNLWALRGDSARAEKHYRQALKLDPGFLEGYVNLADLVRNQGVGGDRAAERVLREGLNQIPRNSDVVMSAPLHHALGLNLVRQKRQSEAIKSLAEAARRAPNNARYAYVHGVALHSSGDAKKGKAVLQAALLRQPNAVDLLTALAQFAAQSGQQEEALRYVGRLQAIDPQNSQYRQLAQQIIGQSARP